MSRPRAWSRGLDRLKPVQQDPLEAIGLPSKGDTKLLNPKTQEAYYAKIVTRYMEFCAYAGQETHALDRAFASMNLDGASDLVDVTNSKPRLKASTTANNALDMDPSKSQELSTLLMAMRKLREGIVGSGRADEFAAAVYMFVIRAAILTATFESYHAALLHLLYRIHPNTPLPSADLHDFVGYHILDVACRLGDYGEAFAIRNRSAFRDERVEGVLLALVRDDWTAFWRLKLVVDGYQRALMGWAEEGVRKHALKCLGRSYLSVDKTYVEACGGRSWEELKALNGVGWELEKGRVIIR